MSSVPHHCIAFLREIGDHVATVSAGASPAEVASGCAACTRRLAVAVFAASGLRRRPTTPAHPAMEVEAVFERIVEDYESTQIAGALKQAPRAPGVDGGWPLQDLEPQVASALREGPAVPSAWLDDRMRSHFGGRTAAGALATRRAAVLAASVALFALFGWRLGGVNGTSTDPEFVFVRVAEMPLLMHPASVLRHGGGR